MDNFPEAVNAEDIPTIRLDEVRRAFLWMKAGKAPGVDNITAKEIDAATQDTGQVIMHRLCKEI